jgi:predicted ATPase
VLVRRAFVPESLQPDRLDEWPFDVPCVRELLDGGIEFSAPVTVFVGENGSGVASMPSSARIVATVSGWVMYGSPDLRRADPGADPRRR